MAPHPPATAPTVADARLVPVALAAWAAAWVATSGHWAWAAAAGAFAFVGLVVALRRDRSRAVASVALMVVALGIGGGRLWQLESSPVSRLAHERAVVELTVVVRSDAVVRPGRGALPGLVLVRGVVTDMRGRGMSWRLRQPVLILWSDAGAAGARQLKVGERVRLWGRLAPAEAGQPLAAVIRARDGPVRVAAPGRLDAAVERMRGGLRAAVAMRPDAQKALVPALVLGDTSVMPESLTADFRTTGLTHLAAVSGANLAILLAFLTALGRGAGLPFRIVRGLGPVAVIAFVALCRSEPSVVRAAAMGMVAWAALGEGARGRSGLRHLCVAVLVLVLVDPWLARSAGFALSVLATGGIVLWAGRWSAAMGWAPRWVAETVCVPLAAQLATQPLVAALSGQVSLVGLLANALAAPLVGPATVLGFAATGASLLSPMLARAFGWCAGWAAQGIVWVAQGCARLPGAALRWPASPVALVVLAAACLILSRVVPAVLERAWTSVAVGLALALLLGRVPVQPGWPPRAWSVIACDVGQGDALLVRAGRGQAIVLDTGPDPGLLKTCLDSVGVRAVPLVVLTHLHADHAGGLDGLWGRPVGVVMLGPGAGPPAMRASVTARALAHGAVVRDAVAGELLTVGEATWRTIAAQSGALPLVDSDGESAAENDGSVVGVAESGGVRTLITGDLGESGQLRLLRDPVGLQCDVLKVPHHGSSDMSDDFYRATGAQIALISVGIDNGYGHPSARSLRVLGAAGMHVLRTDQSGAVAVGRLDQRWRIVTQR